MKKNLAFILALVMILGSLFSVVPMAEEGEVETPVEESGKYIPEISYANVNYTDGIYVMFAVAAPAELAENESVKLLVWESRDDSIAFSYSDTIKDVLDAEAEPVTIGEQSYLVYKYSSLDATEMTDVICARPVIVKDDVATSYGKLVDYSIREYVESAKGNLDGIAAVESEDVLKALDEMLVFGSLAQQFSGDDYKYLADDELKSVYATSIVNGIDKGRAFAGFFKYEEGGSATIVSPFFDGTGIEKITDAEGNIIEDLDTYTDGLQINAIDGDVEIVVYYKNAVARSFSAEVFGEGMEANNYDDVVGGNNLVTKGSNGYTITFKGYGSANVSGVACIMDSYNRMNYWHSIKTVYAPNDPENLVFQLTATNKPALQFSNVTATEFAGIGFGDTVYPAFTFELTLGSVNGVLPDTGLYYFRHRASSATGVDGFAYADLNLFKLAKGKLQLSDGTVIGEVPTDGSLRRFAITIDALTGMTYGYAENVETGVMEKTSEGMIALAATYIGRHNAYIADPVANADLACYENIFSFFTKSGKLEPTWVFGNGGNTSATIEGASVEIDGVMTPLKTVDSEGKTFFNMEAVKAYAEQNFSFLLDDFNLVMGYVYE